MGDIDVNLGVKRGRSAGKVDAIEFTAFWVGSVDGVVANHSPAGHAGISKSASRQPITTRSAPPGDSSDAKGNEV
jgi:hypothetical protein